MRIVLILTAAAMIGGAANMAYAFDDHSEDGVVAPYSVRNLPNGERAPAPVDRVDGGLGSTEVPYNNAQTRSGGPSGGNVTDNGG